MVGELIRPLESDNIEQEIALTVYFWNMDNQLWKEH